MTASNARRFSDWPAALVATLGLLMAVGLQVARERVTPPRSVVTPTLWLASPETARRVMLSFTDLAADLYWIRAVVHYGGERRAAAEDRRYALLYPLLDIATTLDPHFDVAARLGAVFLSEGFPGGPGRPDQALALLEKGLRQDPGRWLYRREMGFVHYWWLKDYPEAARQFELGSQLPGAPLWMRTLAAVTLAKGGDRDGARKLWTEMLASSDVEWVRRAGENRLQQLQALDELDALGAAAATFIQRTGRAPASWQELVAARLLPGAPLDPAGVPYELRPGVGISLSQASPLFPLPTLEGHQ